MVLESIAADGAKSAINIVLSKAWDEILLMWGFRSDLNKLKERLKMMEALLVDLGARQLIRNVELEWFDKVKKAAYEADDLLDEILYEHLRRKRYYKKDRLRARYFFFMCMSNPLGFQWRMAHKVREVMALIDEVFNEASKYGIQAINVGQAALNDGGSLRLQQCRELPDARQCTGRESDEAELVEALCSSFSPSEDLPFVAIVGIGGIGKTTLAKRIYENEAIKNKFSERIWICISDDFDIKKILGQMIEQLKGSKPDLTSNVAHINKLRGLMEGAKYLLVLDDVWNEKEELWQSLKGCLHSIGGSNGSVVLITCRNRGVADSVKSSVVRTLEGLAPEDSRALFEQTVFANEGKCPSSLEVSAGKIIDKCKGVPLAIRTLGAALRSNEDPRHWESIANSELWNTQQFKEIAPYLLISFRHLPSLHVQQCFAFCSIYPKDVIFMPEKMICLWMAHGLLCPEERSTLKMEEIGENYFNILLNHSFLQVESEYGGIRGCKMHDLVHDLARFVSKRDWLICGKGVGVDRGAHISHLVVGSDMTDEVSTPSFMEIMSTRLRTVRSFVELPSARLMQSRYVRVLMLRGIGLKEVPNVVGELKHLRFLDVSGNPIKELPESITTLYHLQTLDLRWCPQLDKLPKGLSRLINLRHLFAYHFVEVPTGIERLTCLQTLPAIQLSASGGTSGLGELGCLPDVKGIVRVSGLEHVKSKEEAQKAGFGRKTGTSDLTLRWSSLERVEGSGVIEEEVLDGLQPHPNIRVLAVIGFSGDSFPSWLRRMTVVSGNNGPSTSLDNLVHLEFQGCGRCERLPALGKLPHLRTLLIQQMEAVRQIGTEFYTYDDGNDVQPCSSTSRLFPALKTLKIKKCPKLEAWLPPKTMDPSQAAFPCLEELKIIDCPFLTITPTDFPSLRGLKLKQIRSAQPLHNILNTNGNNNDSRSPLTSLILEEIQELTNLHQGLSHRLTSLETLEITGCHKLDCLPDDLGQLISLKKLHIQGCTKLKTFPKIGGLCSLIGLWIAYCGELEEIPSGLDRCTSLQTLAISDCPNMGLKRSLEEESRRGGGEVTDYWTGEWLGRLPHLRDCVVGGNGIGLREEEEPDRFVPDITPLLALRSLRYLGLVGWPKLKSLPDQLERFTLLEQLSIIDFDGMEEIPESIGGLSSLCLLDIVSCSNLKSFPSRGAMLKLKQLNALWIWRCPLLTEGCRKDDGPEWHKISHIKYIDIDDDVIQDLWMTYFM